MRRMVLVLLCVPAIALLMAGCAKTRLEMDYGTSHKLQIYNQILDPQAENNVAPVHGMDGVAAQSAVDKYRKRAAEKPPEETDIYKQRTGITYTIGK